MITLYYNKYCEHDYKDIEEQNVLLFASKVNFSTWNSFFHSLALSADLTSYYMIFKTSAYFQFYFGVSNYSDWWKYLSSLPPVEQGSAG